jgi:hypothetical protein
MRTRVALLALLLCQSISLAAVNPSHELMTFLTSSEIDGREAGTPEAARVADTLAVLLQRAGVRPAGDDGYFQYVVVEAPRVDSAKTRVQFYFGGKETQAALGDGLFFFPRQGRTQILTAPVMLGGYGIVAPEFGREDYEAENAKGKFLVLFLGAPRDSMFLPGSPGFRYTLSPVKTRIAQESGALGVFFVEATGDSGRLQREVRAKQEGYDPKILQLPGTQAFPVLYLDTRYSQQLLGNQGNNEEERTATLTLSFEMAKPCTLRNVVGVVQGTDTELTRDYILAGAHYDHLGRRGETYFPGADDNASGVVALLAVAQATALHPLPRSVIFAFFDGEEKGLLGSKYLANHPPLDAHIQTMLNLDEVGRKPNGPPPMGSPVKIESSELTVFYSSQAPWIQKDLEGIAAQESLKVTWEAYPTFHEFSDHAPFHAKKIPVLFFFDGAYGDSNSSQDTPDKIDWGLLARRAQFVFDCVKALGKRSERDGWVDVGGN